MPTVPTSFVPQVAPQGGGDIGQFQAPGIAAAENLAGPQVARFGQAMVGAGNQAFRLGSAIQDGIDEAATKEADVAAGRIEFLVKWAPNAYCHYHRHLGETTVAVLLGEQHIHEEGPLETVHKIRQAGFTGRLPDGEMHMEHAGKDGMTILFSIHAPDGRLFDLLDRQGNILMTVTIEDVVERRLGEPA